MEYSTTSLGTISPTRAQRSADGSSVLFIFGGDPVWSGAESRFLFIITEATDFVVRGSTKLSLQGGESTTVETATPVRHVEPGCRDIDFEDLTPGMVFPYAGAFASHGVLIRVREFYSGVGACVNPYTSGAAIVGDHGYACGSGNEIHVGNVNLEFDYGIPLAALVIHYGEYGGNVNLQVNGDCHSVQDFADLPPFVGGVGVLYDIMV